MRVRSVLAPGLAVVRGEEHHRAPSPRAAAKASHEIAEDGVVVSEAVAIAVVRAVGAVGRQRREARGLAIGRVRVRVVHDDERGPAGLDEIEGLGRGVLVG